jgi:hypothetical protein
MRNRKNKSFVFTESDDQQETSDGSVGHMEGNYKNNDGDNDMDSFSNFSRRKEIRTIQSFK